MDERERINSRQLRQRKDRLIVAIITALFMVCSIAVFATKYKTEFIDWFHGNEETTESVATPTNIATGDVGRDQITENITKEPTTEATTEAVTEEPETEASTEETTTEEITTEVASTDVLNYIDTEKPELSGKGDDWYNADLYIPGNVTDDAYFDTALLIGDSRTEGLSLYTGLSNMNAFYSKGLNIEKVMTEEVVPLEDGTMVTVLEALNYKQYDNIYISFGLNELGWAYDYLFIEAYQEFIDAVREIEPDAVIYVQNILPVSKALSDEDEIYNNPKIESYNALLKDMCMEYGDVIYLDVASSVAVDGALPADASTDGRHCNRDYCEKWLDYIRQNVYVRK